MSEQLAVTRYPLPRSIGANTISPRAEKGSMYPSVVMFFAALNLLCTIIATVIVTMFSVGVLTKNMRLERTILTLPTLVAISMFTELVFKELLQAL